ncbi:MAG TPA: choice-of-anchor D domain-containing protein, partial [Chroococcidiopsis sp.]
MLQSAPNNPLSLAKKGDPQAIAALINHSLKPQGITVQARVEADYLLLILESPKPLAQKKVVALLQKGLDSLGIETLHKVRLYAKQTGNVATLWTDEIRLNAPSPHPGLHPTGLTPLAASSLAANAAAANAAFAQSAASAASASSSTASPPSAPAGTPAGTPTGTPAGTATSISVQGNLQGQQLAIGSYINQTTIYGDKVDILATGERPTPIRRSPPTAAHYCQPVQLRDRVVDVETITTGLYSASPIEIYGEPGLGKTSLLKALAYHTPLTQACPNGLIFKRVRQQSVSDLAQTLFDALFEYQSVLPTKPTEADLRRQLEGIQCLTLLDDVQWSREDLEELHDTLPSFTFLLASHQRHVWGQGKAIALTGLPVADAVGLVEQELRRSLSPAERPQAEALCHTLGGHPLRILEASAWVREQNSSLAVVVEQLQNLSLEELLLRTSSNKPDAERRSLAVLAVLNGNPVPAQHLAVLAAVPEINTVLDVLGQQHLVLTDGVHYQLSPNLIQPLQNLWDLSQWSERVMGYFSQWVQGQPAELLLQSSDLLMPIMQQALEQGQWQTALQIGRSLDAPLMLSKQWGAWERVLRWSLQAAESSGDTSAAAWSMHQLGTRALCLEDYQTAQSLLTHSLRLRESLAETAAAAVTQHNLNLLLGAVQSPEESTEESAELLTAIPAASITSSTPWLWKLVALGTILGAAGLGWWVTTWFKPTTPSGELPITVSRDRLDFGNQSLNSASDPQTVTLTNTGSQPLTIQQLLVSGDPVIDFQTQDDCTTAPLPPGDDCTVTVQFAPQQLGGRQSTLTLVDGQGLAHPILALSGTGQAAPTNVALKVEPSRLNFGRQSVERPSAPQSLTLTNTGTLPIVLKGVSPLGEHRFDFQVSNTCTDVTLAPGKTCTVEVTFNPLGTDTRSATVAIAGLPVDPATPEPEQRLWTIPITGVGVATSSTPTPTATLQLDPARVSFGAQTVDSRSEPRTLTLSNSGNATLQLGEIAPVGDDASQFAVVNDCGRSLPAGAECVVTVRFTPSAEGDRSAYLSIPNSASATPRLVSLTGTGTAPAERPPQIRQVSITPGEIDAGEAAELCYQVENASQVSISGIGSVTPSGCTVVRPTETTAYTLTATNGSGQSVSSTVQLNVRAAATPAPPEALTPGTPDSENAETLDCLNGVTLNWQPGSNVTPSSYA